MNPIKILNVLAFSSIALASAPAGAQDLPFELTENPADRARCDHYDAQRQAFFGVTHLHTGLSFDASFRFVDYMSGNSPLGAYRFAQGKDPITLPDRIGIQGIPASMRRPVIDKPIDWGGVTDHSEHFGEMGICKDFLANGGAAQDVPGRLSMDCRMLNGFYWQPEVLPINGFQRNLASNAFTQVTVMGLGPSSEMTQMPVCINNSDECSKAELKVWEEHQAAAEAEYDRSKDCSFTTFNAYEVTSTPSGTNWHRNVFFRNDRVVKTPVTAIHMAVRENLTPTTGGPKGVGVPPNYLGGEVPVTPDTQPITPGTVSSHPLPERLWDKLQKDCIDGGNVTDGLATRCDVLTIPHNSNLGGGAGLIPPMFYDPDNKDDAALRAKWEPLVEIYQNKGSSECRWDPRYGAGVETSDEFCNFEILDTLSLSAASGVGTTGTSTALPPTAFNDRAFVRNIWKDGLALSNQFDGVNPFKMGVVASSDSHNGTMGWHPENEKFPGHLGIDDASPVEHASSIQNSTGGHSVVWAEENSRDSIFEALRRKETYGTSGTRIKARFFGGWDFDPNLCSGDLVTEGYSRGVPMGGDLPARPEGSQPTFILAGWQDTTPLEQIQIIKGWVDEDGETHEEVHRVAGIAGDPNNPQNSVDLNTCEPTSDAGSAQLCAVWRDTSFDPGEKAFYYARVLERPVCRYSTKWCMANIGVNPLEPEQCQADLQNMSQSTDPDVRAKASWGASCCMNQTTATYVQPVIQERAWTSPIWYTPASVN
ncbi:DUF3604 domain-containing protein [Breoghania sp. L-A4]|uniref:DUF3604 domain-containing protein n=1 Tax=Breoghania sp. L-A4 TaxID=2304600 RepID=UPI000E35A0CA|nr:DUF3604 domain-containing protein [Breoghania sp. L-A4]AXS38790.1 DUF3604 domain-containing protein [Breoghania sp. L-A4]